MTFVLLHVVIGLVLMIWFFGEDIPDMKHDPAVLWGLTAAIALFWPIWAAWILYHAWKGRRWR